MTAFEYRVVPAPRRGQKERGLKTAEDRYARALQGTINELGAKGWEYLRAETLPCEERQGLGGRKTVYHSVLVFRRAAAQAAPATPVAAEPMAQPAQPGLSASRGEAPAAPRAMPSAREAQDIPDRPAPEVTTKSGD
ncbi:DUF4177 domain-containing protein [Limimaricola cinnabarinus]|jgi:hypothetical protein|uniref:DUF4177 domain-containing protein n=1 Tax=Limimaricola cinnabarinus TaxID=1125964 RepID=A0A2G1MKV4_9RHOB|nr:DUF4177 domain-containing protein [Limimaricola cinnabarinus]PHP29389.1 hypothetical protein CJ301_02685 [Limimaricola cinnabarinus]